MKVEVVEWNGVASWHWDLNADGKGVVDELCGICRVPFDGTCPTCKFPGTDCPLILGEGCTHNFHLHCILKWLEQDTSKGLCPMCRQVFDFKKETKMGTKKELQELRVLIEGHRAIRERPADQEFDSYDEDVRMTE